MDQENGTPSTEMDQENGTPSTEMDQDRRILFHNTQWHKEFISQLKTKTLGWSMRKVADFCRIEANMWEFMKDWSEDEFWKWMEDADIELVEPDMSGRNETDANSVNPPEEAQPEMDENMTKYQAGRSLETLVDPTQNMVPPCNQQNSSMGANQSRTLYSTNKNDPSGNTSDEVEKRTDLPPNENTAFDDSFREYDPLRRLMDRVNFTPDNTLEHGMHRMHRNSMDRNGNRDPYPPRPLTPPRELESTSSREFESDFSSVVVDQGMLEERILHLPSLSHLRSIPVETSAITGKDVFLSSVFDSDPMFSSAGRTEKELPVTTTQWPSFEQELQELIDQAVQPNSLDICYNRQPMGRFGHPVTSTTLLPGPRPDKPIIDDALGSQSPPMSPLHGQEQDDTFLLPQTGSRTSNHSNTSSTHNTSPHTGRRCRSIGSFSSTRRFAQSRTGKVSPSSTGKVSPSTGYVSFPNTCATVVQNAAIIEVESDREIDVVGGETISARSLQLYTDPPYLLDEAGQHEKPKLQKTPKQQKKQQNFQTGNENLKGSNKAVNHHNYSQPPSPIPSPSTSFGSSRKRGRSVSGASAKRARHETNLRKKVSTNRVPMAAITTNEDNSDRSRRDMHNELERDRRGKLAKDFNNLRRSIPSIQDDNKAPKVKILKNAITLINDLNWVNEIQEQEKADLQAKHHQLIAKLARLQKL